MKSKGQKKNICARNDDPRGVVRVESQSRFHEHIVSQDLDWCMWGPPPTSSHHKDKQRTSEREKKSGLCSYAGYKWDLSCNFALTDSVISPAWGSQGDRDLWGHNHPMMIVLKTWLFLPLPFWERWKLTELLAAAPASQVSLSPSSPNHSTYCFTWWLVGGLWLTEESKLPSCQARI